MSAPASSAAPFFSFGPDDSFISKNFEGLRYRHLPSSLKDLIAAGNVLDVHWASLGPAPESWVLSFTDSTHKHNLAWGSSIPPRLSTHLSKLAPSPHLRTFLGPGQSYFVWDPNSIRWSGLPPSLEDSLQSWLTPSGWKAGPPRIVTWGEGDAFFAMSEYGDVAYRLGGEEWPTWKETVDEWKGERAFLWSEVAYVGIDSSGTLDQFVAIRNDGTWAGAIDDSNEEALEAFALNFFRLVKPKTTKGRSSSRSQPSQPGPQPQTNGYHHSSNTQSQSQSQSRGRPSQSHPQPNGHHPHQNHSQHHNHNPRPPPNARSKSNTPPQRPPSRQQNHSKTPDPNIKAYYESWATSTSTLFASALTALSNPTNSTSPSPPSSQPPRRPKKIQIRSQSNTNIQTTSAPALLSSFPYLPPYVTTCTLPPCVLLKRDPAGLRACKHDVERAFRASGLYSYEFLRQERLRWHPDRFGRLCEIGFREEGRRVAEEMFKVLEGLASEEAKRVGG